MTTAFVLGGGGLLGAHEVGMLRALADAGIRPDLVKRPVTSWADLISPDFKGKAALQESLLHLTTGDYWPQ